MTKLPIKYFKSIPQADSCCIEVIAKTRPVKSSANLKFYKKPSFNFPSLSSSS